MHQICTLSMGKFAPSSVENELVVTVVTESIFLKCFLVFLITFLCHESYITFLLQHPFCGHGYTRAVIQDLLDTYKRKKGDKGNIAGPGDDDDDEDDAAPVDEVRLLRSVM